VNLIFRTFFFFPRSKYIRHRIQTGPTRENKCIVLIYHVRSRYKILLSQLLPKTTIIICDHMNIYKRGRKKNANNKCKELNQLNTRKRKLFQKAYKT